MRRFQVWLVTVLLRLLGHSLRMDVEDHAGIFGHPEHAPIIIAVWHNRVGLMPYFYERYMQGRDLYSLISLSRDGQFIADVSSNFGIKPVRGSSSREGARAALRAIRALRDPKSDLSITPDGPRGPRYQIQPGLLRLAQTTGRGIVVVTTDLSAKVELRSWDRFQVPLPFSACKLITRGPFNVPEHASPEELEMITNQVAQMLGGD
jgi:lysophospholipid acyltransferase (LPLAT)-like uncharacterized protein